jgi:hypothetical protein
MPMRPCRTTQQLQSNLGDDGKTIDVSESSNQQMGKKLGRSPVISDIFNSDIFDSDIFNSDILMSDIFNSDILSDIFTGM